MILKGKSLKSNFIRFMIPSVAAQLVFAMYTAIDGIFVAKGISEIALGAISIASPFTNLLFSISLIFGVGSSTIIAFRLGKGEYQKANEIYTQNLIVTILLGAALSIIVLCNIDAICIFLGATPGNFAFVKTYISTVAIFSTSFMIAYSFEMLVKADGAPRFALISIISGSIVHILLDYILVIVLRIGIVGAGLATGISQTFLVFFYLIHFLGKNASLHFSRFHFSLSDTLRTVRIGLPSGLTECSAGIIVLLFNHAIVAHIGEDALVSYSIISYANTIVVMSMAGIAQGAQPLISYHNGKGDRQSGRALLNLSMKTAVIFAAAAFALCIMGADLIASMFISADLAELRAYSASAFRIFSTSYLILGFNIVVSGYYTAMERSGHALIISCCRGFFALYISLSILGMLFGGAGIWWAATLSEVLTLLVTIALSVPLKKRCKQAV